MRDLLIALLLFLLVLAGSSCVRYKTTSSTRIDTIYIHKTDTIRIKGDTVAIHKVDSIIETVFVEIEKECPQLSGKTGQLKAKIKTRACNMESLTGGELRGATPDLKHDFRMVFKDNEATVIWDRWEPEIHKDTQKETVRQESYFKKVLDTWGFWVFPWVFFFIWLFRRISG